MKDLEFIRKHVKVWPDGAETVRLDRDGEICFMAPIIEHDFRPKGYDVSMFNPDESGLSTGKEYTRGEWSPKDLTTLDVTFGELDRDTQLRLVSHVLDGGDVEEHIVNDVWYVQTNEERGMLSFRPSSKYRAVEITNDENQD